MQRDLITDRPLRREVVLPTASAPSPPFMLVGLSLVALCLAASLDAFLMQQSEHQARQNEDTEMQVQALRSHARTLASELTTTRQLLHFERGMVNARKALRAAEKAAVVIQPSNGVILVTDR